ncbi:MAG TPA: SMP-30/gluconolactonase/LRE family protein [Steroidobacteraceae bacterium]|nr:SMP-30/gluconolactonase/LRE family protein [Steroidobacteraceae bacterium]
MSKHIVFLLIAASITSLAWADSDIRILNGDAHFPQGPVWYRGRLYYVEYERNTVTTWDGHKTAVFATEKGCGPSAVIPTVRGEFITTCYDNGTIGRISADGRVLSAYTHDKDGNRFVGPNDFAPDTHSGIYFTASGSQGPSIDAKVFYIAADGTITQMAVDLHNANGLAVSPGGDLLYVVETDENRLVQFRIGADGTLSERRVFVNLDDLTAHGGHIWPAGVKIDSQGEIYIGQTPRDPHASLAGQIFVVSAEGQLLRTLTLPSPGVPNFAFSPDEKTLFVTAVDQLDQKPYQGKLYAISTR